MRTKTEDDTFRALSRAPWSEVRRLYDDLYREPDDWITQEDEARFFKSLGWTFREFVDYIVENK